MGGCYNWKRFSVIRQMVEGGWGDTFKLDFTVVENWLSDCIPAFFLVYEVQLKC